MDNLLSDTSKFDILKTNTQKTLADEKNDFDVSNETLADEKVDLDKLLFYISEKALVFEQESEKTLADDEKMIIEKPDFDVSEKTLVFEKADEKMIIEKPDFDSSEKTLANDETLVFEQENEQTLADDEIIIIEKSEKNNDDKWCYTKTEDDEEDNKWVKKSPINCDNWKKWGKNKNNSALALDNWSRNWGGNKTNGDSAAVHDNWSRNWETNSVSDGDSAAVHDNWSRNWSGNKTNGVSDGDSATVRDKWSRNWETTGVSYVDSAAVPDDNWSRNWGGNKTNGVSDGYSATVPDYWSRNWGRNKKNEFSRVKNGVRDNDSAMVGAGLYNLGNTCFLNAILQCFTHTVPLIEGLRSHNHPKPCDRDSEGFCVFCALHNHIELAITGKGKRLSPLDIVENLNQLSCDFRRYQQEDAHELLQCLLNKLDTCCYNSKTDESDESLVRQLFGGRLVSKLQCCNCGHSSDTFESLIDLSLEIENMNSLPMALESFTKVEKIEDEEPQFTCESCEEKVTVEKQLMVDHAPSIAAFHLKRFKNDGSRVEKIETHVEFPLELDLNPYTSGGLNHNVDLDYSLYAVVEHSGFSPTSGHYFCFVRTSPDAWYRLDDGQVTRVSETHVLSRDAYILLYAKKGTPWFSSFMETENLAMDSSVFRTSPKSVLEDDAKQSSESSPTIEANFISEVSEEDRREASSISGLSFSPSRCQDETGEVKSDPKIDKKCKFIASIRRRSLLHNRVPVSESSPIMETNFSRDAKAEDIVDIMETPRSSSNDYGKDNRENEDDNSSRKDGKFTRSADFNSSSSQKSYSPIRASRLFFDDFTLDDGVDGAKDEHKAENKLSPSEKHQVKKKLSPSGKRVDVRKRAEVNSSTVSGLMNSKRTYSIPRDHVMTQQELPCKRQLSDDRQRKEACKLLKGMSGSKRRSQLLAVVNGNRELSLNNKKAQINKPSPNMEDGTSNAHRLNPNLVSGRRPVAPGRS